ncbi:uncharacterized protein LOC100575815 [Acyrthosiphon pisum]|uniref:Uncharacterized protein n=1 Tax=Acyrthosiphon pisum TaxID=7029 RepID=A0A8R1X2Z9_ACYPI|nr:uncharacterized protein LOC100575815 [Acyrthosiphon pisum]|eukprot:XP_008178876.1 PREDICTED: uncharacterized protein LOC100575815 [Acyrthosiphon pisum]
MAMDSAGSARYLLAVAIIAMAISLGCAASIFGLSLSGQRNTDDSAPTSLLSKLPLPLPKITTFFNTEKDQSPQTSPDNKQQDSQQPPQQQLQQSTPKPTVVEQPDGKDPYQSLANASVTTSPRPKLETTTHDRTVIEVPLKDCGVGKRINKRRECVDQNTDPEAK